MGAAFRYFAPMRIFLQFSAAKCGLSAPKGGFSHEAGLATASRWKTVQAPRMLKRRAVHRQKNSIEHRRIVLEFRIESRKNFRLPSGKALFGGFPERDGRRDKNQSARTRPFTAGVRALNEGMLCACRLPLPLVSSYRSTSAKPARSWPPSCSSSVWEN